MEKSPNERTVSPLELAGGLLVGNAVRLAGSPDFLKKFSRSLPILGDLYNVGYYLFDPDEPSLEQRIRNSVIIGGGGALASLATSGLDAIPVVMQTAGELGEEYDVKKTPIDPAFQAAPLLNVENYLREYAYSMNPDKEVPEDKDGLRRFKKVFTDLQELENMTSDFKRIYGGN